MLTQSDAAVGKQLVQRLGRRFERIDEVYFFEVREGRLARAWA